jgi:hypothetical protein
MWQLNKVRSKAKEGNVGCRGKIFADKIRAIPGDLLGAWQRNVQLLHRLDLFLTRTTTSCPHHDSLEAYT